MIEQEIRTWAEIRLDNIRHNYHVIRARLPEGCRFLGVVKANAYGHGAVRVSRMLQEEGADYLAVACLDEALELRQNGITMPVMILGVTPAEYADKLIEHDITQAVSSCGQAAALSRAAQRCGKTLRVHIKVDSGMSRLGFLAAGEHFDECVRQIAAVCQMDGLDAEGIFTHFAVSDEKDAENVRCTQVQFELFCRVIDAVQERAGIHFRIRHCMNSGAAENYPAYALDMARPGLLLYGYGDESDRYGLRPGMNLKTRILMIKEYGPGAAVSYGRTYVTTERTRMAVLGIGYADGLHRLLSGKCSFDLRGQKIPQRGNICMDMCMADVTAVPEAAENDVVEIFGEHNDLAALSAAAQTIPYELLCAVSSRIPRVYDEA